MGTLGDNSWPEDKSVQMDCPRSEPGLDGVTYTQASGAIQDTLRYSAWPPAASPEGPVPLVGAWPHLQALCACLRSPGVPQVVQVLIHGIEPQRPPSPAVSFYQDTYNSYNF